MTPAIPFCFTTTVPAIPVALSILLTMPQHTHSLPSSSGSGQPRALIYAGLATTPDLAMSVGHLLRTSPSKFAITYVGGNASDFEDDDVMVPKITSSVLSQIDLFAVPGGPDLDAAAHDLQPSSRLLKSFLRNGGRYLGFCLGMYLAGSDPGLSLLPPGWDTDAENCQAGAQVTHCDPKDTVVEVTYWAEGEAEAQKKGGKKGKEGRDVWLYFQDGALLVPPSEKDVEGLETKGDLRVLARYKGTDHIAMAVLRYGKGLVGVTGPHPEATEDWYDLGFTNPQGVDLEYGYNLVETTWRGLE